MTLATHPHVGGYDLNRLLKYRDEGIGFLGLVFPAIDELAGADEDALTMCWHPESLDVWASDVADTPFRCGQQAKDRVGGSGRSACAARRRAKQQHQHLFAGFSGNTQLHLNLAALPRNAQCSDRTAPADHCIRCCR